MQPLQLCFSARSLKKEIRSIWCKNANWECFFWLKNHNSFLLTNSHKSLDSFSWGKRKKNVSRRRKRLTRSTYRIFMFIFASAVQKTFFISPTLTRALLLPSKTATVMMRHVCGGAGVADVAELLTPITSKMEKLDRHKHYLHYSHSLENSCRYFIIL